MDHNYDLLKCHLHRQTQQFLEVILYNDLLPTITRPTRITQTIASLIDNIFVTKTLHHNFDSLILLNDMSDHLPMLTLLKQTKIVNRDPIIFEIHCLNDVKLGKIKHELSNIDWNGHLNSEDCNVNWESSGPNGNLKWVISQFVLCFCIKDVPSNVLHLKHILASYIVLM